MPRTPPSAADRTLVAYATSRGVNVTARQVERWRAGGLLPINQVQWLGRGRGSTSTPSPEAQEIVVWLAQHAGPGKRPGDLALLAFGQGLAVPETTVRKAFAGAVATPSPNDLLPGQSAEDTADAAAAKCGPSDLVPSRIRRIDASMAAVLEHAGTSIADVTQTVLSQYGRQNVTAQTEPATRRDWVHASTLAAIEGASTLDVGYMGMLARGLAPTGVPAPAAEDLELRWPGSEHEAEWLLTPEGGLAVVPDGSMHEVLGGIAGRASLPDLLQAWQIAAHLPVWANDLCDRVEAALSTCQSTETLIEWLPTMFGPVRLVLVSALRSTGQSASRTAVDALTLLFQREALQRILLEIPNAEVENLKHPWVYPSFMTAFMTGLTPT